MKKIKYLFKPLKSTSTPYLDDTVGVHSLWAAMFSVTRTLQLDILLPPRTSLPSAPVCSAENASKPEAMQLSAILPPQWLRSWTPNCKQTPLYSVP